MANKEELRAQLRKINAFSLPSNPSDNGFSAQQIKERFYWGEDFLLDLIFNLVDGQIVVKKAEQDQNGNIIVSTYATKNELAAKLNNADIVINEYGNVNGIVVNGVYHDLKTTSIETYSKEEIDIKVQEVRDEIPTIVVSSNNGYVVVNGSQLKVYDDTELRQLIAGKNVSWVINDISNITGTKDSDDNFTNVVAIVGLDLSIVKVGDNIYIKDTHDPDYWITEKSNANVLSLMKLADKTDLSNYYDKDTIDTLLAQKQNVIDSSHKLSASLIQNDSTHRFVSDTEKTTWNNKANASDIKNATITIKYNGVVVDTFTLNQSTNKEINIVGGSSGGGTWGSITGDIEDQEDLIDLVEQYGTVVVRYE